MRATPWTSPSIRRPRRSSPGRWLPLFAILLLLIGLDGVAAPRGAGDTVRRLHEALAVNRAAGDYDMCRELLEELRTHRPADPRVPYNLACIETLAGHGNAALVALREAAALGWDDVRTLEADRDLAKIHARQAYKALIVDLVDALMAEAQARVYDLEDGRMQSLDPLSLRGGKDRIRLDMGFDDDGLRFDVTSPPGVFAADGDGELELTIAVPDSLHSFDTRRAWRFGFGMNDGTPYGRLIALPGRAVGEPMSDLAPVLRPAPAGSALEIRIPWAYLEPYTPPADMLYGVNVGFPGSTRIAPLIGDPALSDPGAEWRRFRPVRLHLDADSTPCLAGHVSNALVGLRPVEIELVAWCAEAGEYVLSTDVQDEEFRSVVGTGGEDETVALQAGRNVLLRRADLSGLPEDPYRVTATLTSATGETTSWQTRLLRLRGDWTHLARDRAKPLSPEEQSSLLWRLDLIDREMAKRDVRMFPTALWSTVRDVEALLARHAETGTILPESGDMILLCPVGPSRAVRQTLHLAEGWATAEDAPVLALLDAGGRHAQDLGPALADRLDTGSGVVVAVPRIPAHVPGVWDPDADEAARAVFNWLDRRFPERPLRLALLGDGLDTTDFIVRRGTAPVDVRRLEPGEGALEELLAWMRIR